MSQLLISAAHKSSGKTTISIGLCASLRQQGLTVAPFKKGPDYIDPLWLTMASGRACHTLDFHTASVDEVVATFTHHGADADLCLIEGNKGLYDGMDLEGSNSNAALAKLLGSPVVLVIDTRGTIRGVAPLLLGYQEFDKGVTIAGVILNQVGGARHEAKLRSVVEHYTDIPVLGAIGRNAQIAILERHLGLIPGNEDASAEKRITDIARIVSSEVDLEALLAIARLHPLPARRPFRPAQADPAADVSIGIARDSAFGFYYSGDLDEFARAGARLVPFDTLTDHRLPDVDGLFIGGGFPETHMDALESNSGLRSAIRDAIEAGLPAYAECGGLMYLGRTLTWGDRQRKMVGVLPLDIVMHDRPQGRGYVQLRETSAMPWPWTPDSGPGGDRDIAAHEFHYSSIAAPLPNLTYAYQILRGAGIDGASDGIVYRNLVASYTHLRHTGQDPWVSRFVQFVRQCKRKNSG